MERFKKEILVNNESRTFEFTRMKNMNGIKFFVTSKDAEQKPIAFSLIQGSDGNWKLLRGSLRWLYAIESELSDAILDTRIKL
jgi:hypothetical protein